MLFSVKTLSQNKLMHNRFWCYLIRTSQSCHNKEGRSFLVMIESGISVPVQKFNRRQFMTHPIVFVSHYFASFYCVATFKIFFVSVFLEKTVFSEPFYPLNYLKFFLWIIFLNAKRATRFFRMIRKIEFIVIYDCLSYYLVYWAYAFCFCAV